MREHVKSWRQRLWCLWMACLVVSSGALQAVYAAPTTGPYTPLEQLPGPPPQCSLQLRKSIAWGVGDGVYPVEGATHIDGRADSVWDVFDTGHIAGHASAAVAADFYHKWPQDVAMMRRLGVKHFRRAWYSISWPRLIPGGVAGSPVNPAAASFYSRLFDGLSGASIQPLVALYFWDMPQVLQQKYGGFTSSQSIDDYLYFADAAFRLFGGRVKLWLTFVEPFVVCNQQYGNGQYAPGIDYGDKGRYACGHNVLLAHARAVQLYRSKYTAKQGGKLSFSTLFTWPEPATGSEADKRAAQNKLDAEVGWFLDPIFKGDYPASLRAAKGAALPRFTQQQQQLVRGSLDFVAANALTAKWVSAADKTGARGWRESKYKAGVLIGPQSGISWINAVPWSQERMLRYVQLRYGDPEVLITTSGTMVPGERDGSAKSRPPQVRDDAFRTEYYRQYLGSVCAAVQKHGVRLIGWYAWSLLDSFEWTSGYSETFGVVHVDMVARNLTRTPKDSAVWLSRHFWSQSM